MSKMLLLFSHKLTQSQKEDAINSLKIDDFVYLPDDLQELWSSIPADLTNLNNFLMPIKEYIKNNAKVNDIILTQGDFGAVYEMVNFTKNLGLIPVYSTTKREIKTEEIDGKIVKSSVFEHIKFRKF